MYTKDEIKELVKTVQTFKGTYKFKYVPEEDLDNAQKMYGLYYGDVKEITLEQGYFAIGINGFKIVDNPKEVDNTGNIYHIPEISFDGVVDKLHELCNDNICTQISQAMINLDMAGEELKYFDSEKQMFNKFRKEVLRLKNDNT